MWITVEAEWNGASWKDNTSTPHCQARRNPEAYLMVKSLIAGYLRTICLTTKYLSAKMIERPKKPRNRRKTEGGRKIFPIWVRVLYGRFITSWDRRYPEGFVTVYIGA